jgi:hypothetical protein
MHGTYVSGGLNLNNTQKYRLRIKTVNEEYLYRLPDFLQQVY